MKIFWIIMAVLLGFSIAGIISEIRILDIVFGLSIIYLLFKRGEIKIELGRDEKQEDAEKRES